MSKRFGIMCDRSEELKAVPGTGLYCTLMAAYRVAEIVGYVQGLPDIAIYDYETKSFI